MTKEVFEQIAEGLQEAIDLVNSKPPRPTLLDEMVKRAMESRSDWLEHQLRKLISHGRVINEIKVIRRPHGEVSVMVKDVEEAHIGPYEN